MEIKDWFRQIIEGLRGSELAHAEVGTLPRWIDHDSGWAGDSGWDFIEVDEETCADTC
jgi:hypothetical protein